MLFDIRTLVGALLACYGVVLVITGLVDNSAAADAETGGVNVNLWAGVGMIVVAVAFSVWARLRPVPVPPAASAPDESEHTE